MSHVEKARLLRGVLREVDRTMESSSEGFLAANRNFSQATRDIESIQAGHEATTRRRSEDIISAYQALRPQGQAAFRAGYVEPLIARRGGLRFPVPARRYRQPATGRPVSLNGLILGPCS